MIASPRVDRDDLNALSGVYRLLARLWLREVDQALLDALNEPPLRERFEEGGGVPPTDLEQLRIDFCRLFLGPSNHLPPYQSVWQQGQFQTEAVTSMQDFIEVVNCAYDPQLTPMLDHLGVQLDVFATILQRAAEVDQTDALEPTLEIAQRFFARHLSWPKRLLDASEAQADGFYRAVIALTRDLLQSEEATWRTHENRRR